MYQDLLKRIIQYHSNSDLSEQLSRQVFRYGSGELYDYKALVINNFSTVNVYTIFFIERVFPNDKDKLRCWLKIIERNKFRKVESKPKKFLLIGASYDCLCCSDAQLECRNSVSFAEGRIIVCRNCINNIKISGKLKSNYPTALNGKYDHKIENVWYTIDNSSLNLWCSLNNDKVCHRYKLTISNKLSESSLKLCYFIFDSHNSKRCYLCGIFYYKSELYGIKEIFRCEQCYRILNYRDILLNDLIVSKLLLFYNIPNVNRDIKRHIFTSLISIQII